MKGEGMKAGGMMKTNETDRRREMRKIFFAVALFFAFGFAAYSAFSQAGQGTGQGPMHQGEQMGQGMGMIGEKGHGMEMMRGGMMGPGMGMMGFMMRSPELMGSMMSMHGEMMSLMGQMMQKYGAMDQMRP
jgi:hypothetical protein